MRSNGVSLDEACKVDIWWALEDRLHVVEVDDRFMQSDEEVANGEFITI